MSLRAAVVALLAALAACAPKLPPAPPLAFRAASFADLPGYATDRVAEALPALSRS